ncbi:gas vesicle protein [Carboxydichorda subterranea]|uniref:gas vesicle protein n=1 Tax=Carboxydichorda subterranea TaxID=3109565 RepID=UPI00385732F7
MKPARPRVVKGGVADLLERALDKGLVVNADLVVTLSGVPLIALNLRLMLASVETMIRYGVMRDWLQPARQDEEERQGAWVTPPARVPFPAPNPSGHGRSARPHGDAAARHAWRHRASTGAPQFQARGHCKPLGDDGHVFPPGEPPGHADPPGGRGAPPAVTIAPGAGAPGRELRPQSGTFDIAAP